MEGAFVLFSALQRRRCRREYRKETKGAPSIYRVTWRGVAQSSGGSSSSKHRRSRSNLELVRYHRQQSFFFCAASNPCSPDQKPRSETTVGHTHGRMDRAEQSVTRHAAASRAAYETLYVAFASQPAGIKDSHLGVLDSLREELRLDQSFGDEVAARHGKKRSLRGGQSGLGGQGEEKFGVGDAGEGPAIQIEWKEVSFSFCFDPRGVYNRYTCVVHAASTWTMMRYTSTAIHAYGSLFRVTECLGEGLLVQRSCVAGFGMRMLPFVISSYSCWCYDMLWHDGGYDTNDNTLLKCCLEFEHTSK